MSLEGRDGVMEELQALEQANKGLLTRRAVVEKARDKNTALHGYFVWDKSQAAERYWLETAGALIRSYKVAVKVSGSEKSVQTRAFVSLSTDRKNGGGYRTLASVMDNEEMHDQMLADALAELSAFQSKYSRLTELESVLVEIEKAFQQHRLPKLERAAAQTAA